MADLLFICSGCSTPLAVDDSSIGHVIECPDCKQKVMVPQVGSVFRCTNPSCYTQLSAPAGMVGTAAACPNCNTRQTIPLKKPLRLKQPTISAANAEPTQQPYGRVCPTCGSPIAFNAVVCVNCGTNLVTGQRHSTVGQNKGVLASSSTPCPPSTLVLVFSNILIWMVAVIPLAGSALKWISGINLPWVAYYLLYSIPCALDERLLKRTGQPTPNGYLLLFVPVYLWQRATLLSHRMRSYFWAWICAFLLSIAIDHHVEWVSGLETSASGLVTTILKNELGSDVKCTAVKLGTKQTNGVYKARACLDDGNWVEIAVDDKGDRLGVEIQDVISYLASKKQSAIGNTARTEQVCRMVEAHSRSFLKKCIAYLTKENPTQDVADVTESLVCTEGGFWQLRAEQFHQAGDDGPNEAIALYEKGREAGICKDYRQSVNFYSQAVQADAGFPWSLNNLAWTLATCPDKTYLNGPKAVEFAHKSIEAIGFDYWCFADTLAAAFAQCGDFEKAIQWEEIALNSSPSNQNEHAQRCLTAFKNHQPWSANGDRRGPKFTKPEFSLGNLQTWTSNAPLSEGKKSGKSQ